jgi:di/tricarboxylate transporter
MTPDMLIVLGVLLVALVLFVTERIGVDLTAVIVMTVLLVTGILTPTEGLSGFSNSATVTVAAMFVISAALRNTGAVSSLALVTSRMFGIHFILGLTVTMIVVGVVSGLMNNTPVVAVFIPVMLSVAREHDINASKLLMPMSFAAMLGGICTLIGSSTNLLVNAVAEEHGLPSIGMFEFTLLGLIFLAAGVLYMSTIGVRLIPPRAKGTALTDRFSMSEYLTDIVLLPKAPSVGCAVAESPLVNDLDIDVLGVIRDGTSVRGVVSTITLESGDVLRVRGDIRQLQSMKDRAGCAMAGSASLRDEDFDVHDLALLEVIVAPNSHLIGSTVRSARFRTVFHANALALRHRGQLRHSGFRDTRLVAGDALLVEVPREDADRIKTDRNFVVASEINLPTLRTRRLVPALLIGLGVIAISALEVLPITIAAICGCILLVATRCITLDEAYHAIEWKVIFLLGGIISLGTAMEKTGIANLASDHIVDIVGAYGPVAMVGVLYAVTALLTTIMSNNATGLLLAPVAIAAAESMGVSSRPFLMAVIFAASASFMTPVGYQTNTMIYGVGQYRFADFVRVGTPLNVLLLILAVIFIPMFFPF